MKILTVDVGTGTQDIFLYDARLEMENCLRMVMPAPTMLVSRQLQDARQRGKAVLLQGVTMGGGPSAWGAEAHLRAGLAVYATPQAARTFNDDLEKVAAMGVQLLSEDEARRLPDSVLRLELRDFDFSAIQRAFGEFGVSMDRLGAVAVAVFDHGEAPPGVSDRQFRFDYLDERIRAYNRLSAFAFPAGEIPDSMTRLKAVAVSARDVDAPLVVMDTAPAAVLGATFDPRVAVRRQVLFANVGNFHTLAFRLGHEGIAGVLEHHTGFLERAKLERLLRGLADGSLRHAEVFDDQGHGALVYEPTPLRLDEGDFDVAVTGPRRGMFGNPPTMLDLDDRQRRFGGQLRPYFAAPFGDMMMAGCFGLLAATADVLPEWSDLIKASLAGAGTGTAPWDAG